MTPQNEQVLAFIEQFIGAKGFAPTMREIQKHFGWKSVTQAAHNIYALVDAGKISRVEKSGRTIRVL